MSAFAARNGQVREIDTEKEPLTSSDEDEFPMLDPPTVTETNDDEFPMLDPPVGTQINVQSTVTTTISKPYGTKPITVSNFIPNEDNLIFEDDFVIVGLKQGEYLLVQGQYSLVIQRGCLKIDTTLHHAGPHTFNIIAPITISIPVLYSDQVIDRSQVSDDQSELNSHLFTSTYKTVIKLQNLSTGLQNIGLLYPPLKNILPNDLIEEQYESLFKNYTFEIVLHDEGFNSSVIGNTIPKNWLKNIDNITNQIINSNSDITQSTQLRILIVGFKNSGKSTFLKKLLNQLLYKTDYCIPVNVMDLDPGQPEFSPPDSLTISSISQEVIGYDLSSITQSSNILCQKYLGFSDPNRQPQRYESTCNELCQFYESQLKSLDQPLLINTPGWIKGYGIELLKKLCERIKPTHLIYLGAFTDQIDTESELLRNLTYEQLVPVDAFVSAIKLKYSAAQLRNFKILSYLHHTGGGRFDFKPLLSRSPYMVSYNDTSDLNSQGISLVTVITTGLKISQKTDMVNLLELCVVGIYILDLENYQNLIVNEKISFQEGIPNLIQLNVETETEYKGLALIHSVDLEQKLINLYTPLSISSIVEEGKVVVLCRGRTEIPIEEICPKNLFNLKNSQLPYITFDNKIGKGGKVLKVRRNIMRRSQQQ